MQVDGHCVSPMAASVHLNRTRARLLDLPHLRSRRFEHHRHIHGRPCASAADSAHCSRFHPSASISPADRSRNVGGRLRRNARRQMARRSSGPGAEVDDEPQPPEEGQVSALFMLVARIARPHTRSLQQKVDLDVGKAIRLYCTSVRFPNSVRLVEEGYRSRRRQR